MNPSAPDTLALNSSQTTTPRVLLTVEQAADALGIGRTNMFALIKSGEIESVKVGRLRRVPAAALDAYTARLNAQQNPPPLQPPYTTLRLHTQPGGHGEH